MDDLFREKMQNFSPTPPEHIWTGIEKGLARKPVYLLFLNNWRTVSVAILLLFLLSVGTWYFLPSDALVAEEQETTQESPQLIIPKQTEITDDIPKINTEKNLISETQTDISENQEASSKMEVVENFNSEKNDIQPISETAIAGSQKVDANTLSVIKPISEINDYEVISGINALQAENINLELPLDLSIARNNTVNIIPEKKTKTSAKGSWDMGFYFSPEVIFEDFDSVRMLNVYSFNIEPVYYFNNNWFLRFGLGTSFMRDRGFANLDYMSNELMGTYDDVYDVTFDSVDGKLMPTYYTALTEVWDSVRRLTVTEATNKYLYLQAPLLFGYTKKSTHFNWSFYGGPAINFLVFEQTEMSVNNAENITIIDLENRLPSRSPYFLQLWIGASVEYKTSKHLSLALEPNYRYYFSGVYDSAPYKTGFSGFTLRIGVIYKIF